MTVEHVIDDFLQSGGDPLIAAKCAGLMAGYDARWSMNQFAVLSVEDVLTSDLWNPDTKARSRSFMLAGKLDVRAVNLSDGKQVIIDHKTCSEDIADPGSPYWRQLIVENQPRHYELLEWLNGRRADYALWDVVRKPTIRPAQITKAEATTAVINRSYYDYRLNDEEVLSVNADRRETLTMYAARVAYDCTVERPSWYFARRPIVLDESDLIEHARDVWNDGQEILAARRLNRWRRNPKACMLYGSPCRFLGICSGYDQPDSDHWKPREWVHPELPILGQGRGREWLTNSRIATFLTCRKKHFFEYELGIEKAETEDSEALVIGSLLHLCLEHWWKIRIKQGELNDNAVTTANQTGLRDSGSAAE